MANWTKLHSDLLYLIAGRLGQYEDFVSFGCVCRTWSSAATRDSYRGSSAQIPWLILAEEKGDIFSGFYSLSRSKIAYRMLPEAAGKVCYASRGWLITVSPKNLKMNLVHPITRVRVPLPDPTMLLDDDPNVGETFMQKAVLSASPDSTGGGNYTVSVIYGNKSQLAIWRSNGNFTWTKIEPLIGGFSDLIYYQEKLFAMNYGSHDAIIFGFDLENLEHPASKTDIVLENFVGFCASNWTIDKLYMVESCGELLVVVRQGFTVREERRRSRRRRIRIYPKTKLFTYGTTSFKVFKVNLDLSSCSSSVIDYSIWEEMHDLEKRALFLGHSSSFCVDIDAFNKSIKPNSIYFIDDVWIAYLTEPKPTWVTPEGGGKDMGIYNLEDKTIVKTIVPHFRGKSYSRLTPPIWIQPTP